MAKGSEFERKISKQLSFWWSKDERDDLFWRSTTSGARATTRSKQGKDTAGNHGDITATNEIGLPLMRVFTFELKRNYPKTNIHSLVDSPSTSVVSGFNTWIEQAHNSSIGAGSLGWALITKRDRKREMIWTSLAMYGMISNSGLNEEVTCPQVRIRLDSLPFAKSPVWIVGSQLDDWLAKTDPDSIRYVDNLVNGEKENG